MPLIIDNPSPDSCTLEECVEVLGETGFEPEDEGSLAAAALWLRRLSNNREFLGALLVKRLAGQAEELESGYGPQAIMLSRSRDGRAGSAVLRAAIWPAETDLIFRASGAASVVYGAPHDHNFDFLTVGYVGPGYASDHYEYDYDEVAGYPGEAVTLRPRGRHILAPGTLMLYRKHRDIHSQLPPASLSVSLNVMRVDPAQAWFDQYGFDLEHGAVTRVLNPNPNEAMLRVAVASRAQAALDYAEWVGAAHPSSRLRLASFEARAGLATNPAEEDALWRRAERSGSRMVAEIARARRSVL